MQNQAIIAIPCSTSQTNASNTSNAIASHFLRNTNVFAQNVAIRFSHQHITYAQLGLIAQQLSQQFIQTSDKNNKQQLIAIIAQRSSALVASILACSQAGLTFIVIDAAYPAAHIKKIIAAVKPSLLVGIDCNENFLQTYDDNLNKLPFCIIQSDLLNSLAVDQRCDITLNDTVKIKANIQENQLDIAYLLMTSGSTGEPKIIKTGHAPLVHFVDWYVKQFSVVAGTKFSMLSGLSHDPLLRDIFVPLSCGGEICIPNQASLLNSQQLFDWFGQTQINFCHITPQLLSVLCARFTPKNLENCLPELTYVMCGGDALKQMHFTDLMKLSPNCQLVNFYGSSETPQAMAFYCLNAAKSVQNPIPVGYAIDDVKLKVLDVDLNEVASNIEGQIGIETEYLSQGYVTETRSEKQAFVTLAQICNNNTSIQTYLTGDYGYMQPNGALVIKGRIDDQVKIRGYRVELSAVQSALDALQPALNTIVLAQKMANQENCLVAFCQTSHQYNQQITVFIQAELGDKLPSYMQPQHYIWLNQLPLLPNGKVNRAALSEIFQQKFANNAITHQQQSVEKNLINAWQKILGIEKIHSDQSFSRLGGDSLSFIQASLALEKQLGYVPDNWESLSIGQLNKMVKKNSQYSLLNTTVLIRAISIVLIVLAHLYSYNIALTTTVLLMVSGASLAKYQLSQLNDASAKLNLTKNILKIACPTLLISGAVQVFKAELHWPSLFFVTNFIDPTFDYKANYWFIYVFLQSMLIIMLMFTFKPIKKLFIQNRFNFCIAATLIGIVIALIGAFNLNKGWPYNALPYMIIWQIFLGMAMAYAVNKKQKLTVLSIVFLSTIGIWLAGKIFAWLPVSGFLIQINSDETPWFPVFAVLFILYMPKIKVSFVTSWATHLIASSSLFIYLVHPPLGVYLQSLTYMPKGLRLACCTIVFGILISILWNKLTPILLRKLSKMNVPKINLNLFIIK